LIKSNQIRYSKKNLQIIFNLRELPSQQKKYPSIQSTADKSTTMGPIKSLQKNWTTISCAIYCNMKTFLILAIFALAGKDSKPSLKDFKS